MVAVPTPQTTLDSVLHGAVNLVQYKKGYRFTEDAVLLAAFAAREGRTAHRAADLGAGNGVVGLILLHLGAARRVAAVELQRRLAFLARHNAAANRAPGLDVLCGDLSKLPFSAQSLDLIVSNPPYMRRGVGRIPPNRERALARHELACDARDLAAEGARCLAPGGRLSVVYPAHREQDVLRLFPEAGLSITTLRRVLPYEDRPPSLVLFEAQHASEDDAVHTIPPLVTRLAGGSYSDEMNAIFAGKGVGTR